MEQNKVLMIIVSMAIFFAAVMGVGVALLYPRDSADAIAETNGAVREFDPIEYVRRPESAPLVEDTSEDEPVIIVYGDQDMPEGETAERTISELPARSTRDVSDDATDEATGTSISPAGSTPEPTTPAVRSQPPEPATTAPAATPAAARRTDVTPREIRVTEYWIQLIASQSRDRVEQARVTLADYSLGGRVTTRDVDGELFYRLRVGPYESESEAEKFLDWIREIEGFSGAYISEEYPLRTVNG